jgi:sensor domain DACNV-containing protein
MTTTFSTTDLAEIVTQELKRHDRSVPSKQSLCNLFEAMFFSSLATEESQPIRFHITYIDPKNPDPKPPPVIRRSRWSHLSFSTRIAGTVENFAKVGGASDFRTSSLAVYHDSSGEIEIWGLIHQGSRYHEFVSFQSDEGPERPGLFEAAIEGIGHLAVFIDYDKIAELRGNKSIQTTDLEEGPVIKKLTENLRVPPGIKGMNPWPSFSYTWITSMYRLLFRARSYRHGAAFLVTDNYSKGLNIKYKVRYKRFRWRLSIFPCLNLSEPNCFGKCITLTRVRAFQPIFYGARFI